jgi:O-antigen ligase
LFLFAIRQTSWISRIIGAFGLVGASYFLLKTASRGAMVASIVFVLLWLVVSENRARLVVLALPFALVLLVLMPRDTLRRLTMFSVDTNKIATSEDEKAVSSQMEREHLLKESIKYAIKNPLFGIGPGRFGDAIWEDAKSEGRHEASLGTHNTYTQIAAECGIPALIMYVAAIVITIRSSFRLCRVTMRDKSQRLVSALAFTCCVLTAAFAIAIFFHHMAYYRDTSVVLGLWVATEMAVRNQLSAKNVPVPI